jgi:hypothetical protein
MHRLAIVTASLVAWVGCAAGTVAIDGDDDQLAEPRPLPAFPGPGRGILPGGFAGGSGAAGTATGAAGAGGIAGSAGTAGMPLAGPPPHCTGAAGPNGSAGSAGAGAPVPCDVTAACAMPDVCIGGFCQPPLGSGSFCDGVDVLCSEPGTSCIAGYCQRTPGACAQNQDCPSGYLCQAGTCVPSGGGCGAGCPGGQVCVAGQCVGGDQCRMQNAPGLNGAWTFDSRLHLREALASPIRFLLDATELGRSLITGNLTALGVPSWASAIVAPLIQGIINQYVPAWAQDVIVGLGDVSDILDDLRVKETVTLAGDCPTAYRGSSHWDRVEFEFRGMLVSRRPEDVPQIGAVRPEDFGAKVQCGVLFLDKHRVRNVLSGLLRWVLDEVTAAVTCTGGGPCYQSPEDAVRRLADCSAIGNAVAGSVFGLGGGAITTACNGLLDGMLAKLTMAIDASTTTLSILSVQGQAQITDANHLASGRWNGSLVGRDFPGEFTATR